eukprot:5066570-Ditylum_brightwellii.AAC.1
MRYSSCLAPSMPTCVKGQPCLGSAAVCPTCPLTWRLTPTLGFKTATKQARKCVPQPCQIHASVEFTLRPTRHELINTHKHSRPMHCNTTPKGWADTFLACYYQQAFSNHICCCIKHIAANQQQKTPSTSS